MESKQLIFKNIEKNLKEIHGNKYTYILENKKLFMYSYIKYLCPIHGEIKQKLRSHLIEKRGCKLCSIDLYQGWSKTSFNNLCNKNNSDLGIFYILHFKNEYESFYKIGITSRSIKERYSGKDATKYDYKIVQEIEAPSSLVWSLEKIFKKYIFKNKLHYIPSLNFSGSSTECFKIY